MKSENQLHIEFREVLRDYKESGVVFPSPGGGARYCVREVNESNARIQRLTANEDETLNYSYYTLRAAAAAQAGGRMICDDFARTVAYQATCILGDLLAISQDRKAIIHLPDDQAAKKCFIEALENLPVQQFMGEVRPIKPAVMYTVIRGVADGDLTTNEVALDWLLPRCHTMLTSIGISELSCDEVARAYFELSDEFFWLLAYHDPTAFLKTILERTSFAIRSALQRLSTRIGKSSNPMHAAQTRF